MKMPEEIKKGLDECTRLGGCVSCPYFVDNTMAQCTPVMAADALAYIHQLEAKLAELEKRCETEQLNASVAIRELEETKLRCLEQVKMYADKLAENEKPLVPLTLEEVKRHVKEPEAEPVWLDDVEEPSNTGWTYSHIICDWLHGFDERTYGKEWRCWSRKPTDEERKAAKWDE